MLAIVTGNGIGFADPSRLKQSLTATIPVSTSLKCTTSSWASNNTQIYLASASCIKRYTMSEGLLEELYSGSDPVTCLVMTDNGDSVIFAVDNNIYALDCNSSEITTPICPNKGPVTALALANDSSLLALVTGYEVFVHNMKTTANTMLKGLPDGKISCCIFHYHSTKLLLGIGKQVLVYNTSNPSAPVNAINFPGSSGRIVAIASSPFSTTLIAMATSKGDVALVDLDKKQGILKTANLKKSLTALSFNAEGSAIYLGTEEGKLMLLNLRALEREPKIVVVGDGDFSIREINVQQQSKNVTSISKNTMASMTKPLGVSRMTGTRTPVKYSVTPPACDRRKRGSVGVGVKSPVHNPRGGMASKKEGSSKPFSSIHSPFAEKGNLEMKVQTMISAAESSKSRNSDRSENFELKPNQPPILSGASWMQGAGKKITAIKASDAAQNGGDEFPEADTGPPESISARLALMRARSSSNVNIRKVAASGRRIASESARPSQSITQGTVISASSSAQNRTPSTGSGTPVVQAVQAQGIGVGSTQDEDELDYPSSKQPQQPVAFERGKDFVKTERSTGGDLPRIGTPELHAWTKGKGKERAEIEVKKARFLRHPGDSEDSDSDADVVTAPDKDGLSLQVSPRRPMAAPSWVPSPHKQATTGLNMNTAAQDFFQNIVRDVMYEFQRETKAEMMGIHLDLVRMGRGWKRELRETMEEWGQELRQLREENKRLREENERLRRGF